MSFPSTITHFNVFVDGVGYFGRATKATTPSPKIMTESHRAGGWDGTIGIDVGLEAMTAELVFAEWDPAIFARLGTHTRLVVRPAARHSGDGTVTGHVETCGGLITATEKDELEGGTIPKLTLGMDVRYFKHEIAGRVVHEIDIENAVRIVDGVDQLADIRAAMGL